MAAVREEGIVAALVDGREEEEGLLGEEVGGNEARRGAGPLSVSGW
jgi:hypothetical protein